MSLTIALFRHSRKVLHTGSILSQRRDIVLVDKVDLVVFAACVQTLEIICDLKCLVNIRRITQLGKGFYNIELAVCKNILAPAAADNKAIFLTGLLDDRICIVQYRAAIPTFFALSRANAFLLLLMTATISVSVMTLLSMASMMA